MVLEAKIIGFAYKSLICKQNDAKQSFATHSHLPHTFGEGHSFANFLSPEVIEALPLVYHQGLSKPDTLVSRFCFTVGVQNLSKKVSKAMPEEAGGYVTKLCLLDTNVSGFYKPCWFCLQLSDL